MALASEVAPGLRNYFLDLDDERFEQSAAPRVRAIDVDSRVSVRIC